MEITHDTQTNTTTFVTYIGGDAYSAPVAWRSEQSDSTSPLPSGGAGGGIYLHRDYLGSIIMITDKESNILEKRHFDAWGNIVKLQDAEGNDLSSLSLLDRGYTGHEHLQGTGLVHMNGRLYDPVLHRFLAPDNYIQDPFNTQNFNRYGYVLNNPLMFTDPSGEFIHILVGAAIGGLVNLTIKAAQGKIHSFGDGLAAFGIGAVAGGIGAATGGAAFLAAGGGVAGAGGFIAGAVGGMVGTAFASPIQNIGNHLYFGDPIMTGEQYAAGIAIGGLTGGLVNGGIAAFNGKSFLNGNTIGRPQVMPASTLQSEGIKDNSLQLQHAKNEIKKAIPDKGPVNYKAEYYKKVAGPDGAHNWNRTTVEIVADNGKIYQIQYNGRTQTLIQHYGNRFGKEGVFEIIIEKGLIQHQGFVPGGTVNGIYQGVGPVSPPPNWWLTKNNWPFN